MRSIDASKYRVNIPLIATMLGDKTNEVRLEMLSSLALITGVPIIIVATYIQELYGDIPGLSDKKQRLMEFYQVDQILNSSGVLKII